MIWLIIRYYAIISIGIGLVFATIVLWKKRREISSKTSFPRAENLFMEENIKKGHIQKEVYGTRVVYQEKTLYGESSVKTVEFLRNFQENRPKIYVAVLFIVGTISTAIAWPKMLYDWATDAGD